MPNEILALILLAVAALAVFDMLLGGGGRPGGDWSAVERLGWREFATRPLPIFLLGLGAAMLPARPAAGAGILALGAALLLLGRGRSCCKA